MNNCVHVIFIFLLSDIYFCYQTYMHDVGIYLLFVDNVYFLLKFRLNRQHLNDNVIQAAIHVAENIKLTSLGKSHGYLIMSYVNVVEVPLTNMMNYI